MAERNAPRIAAALKAGGGAAAVGWKVRVYWPDEEEWFYGTVAKFDAGSGRHSVKYEVGGKAWVYTEDSGESPTASTRFGFFFLFSLSPPPPMTACT